MDYPELKRAIATVKALRHPVTGCPWDLEQTHESLLKYLIEESYEYVEAVENNDSREMEEEIGDVLFQVLLHTSIAEETKSFSLESAAKILSDKLIRRHPHVFKEGEGGLTTDEIIENWKKIKVTEKGERKYSIDEKYLQAPALTSAFKIGKKSTEVNFDWTDHMQVAMKVEEEWQEVKEELLPNGKYNKERVKEEIGDLLFSVAQLARHLEIDPEDCLREANKKFINRFKKVEDAVRSEGKDLKTTPQDELEEIWAKIKKI